MISLIYLASPYTDSNEAIMARRYKQVALATAYWLRKDQYIISPILNFHPVAELTDLPRDHAFWRRLDERLLASCDELWVLMLPGWEDSVGVREEIIFAEMNNIPISYKEYPGDLPQVV